MVCAADRHFKVIIFNNSTVTYETKISTAVNILKLVKSHRAPSNHLKALNSPNA